VTSQSVSTSTLVDVLVARQESWRTPARAAAVLFMAALTAAAAQISVPLPFTVVPFTFQPMVVLLGGLALGSRLGSASQVVYLLAGLAGLPVFAASATLPPGALRLIGPTAGYLLSYPIAAFVVGRLAERGLDRRYLTSVAAMAVGLAVVYLSGAAWLGSIVRLPGQEVPIGLRAAIVTGVLPFLAADAVELLAAAAILPTVWRLVGRRSR
jgi:biotin transport system substrate-specific component